MARKFVIYINDNLIKVYHANSRILSFYNQYDIENIESITGFLNIIKKYSSWNIYLFLETSEVLVDRKVFDNKNIKKVKLIAKNNLYQSNLLLSCLIPNNNNDRSSYGNVQEYSSCTVSTNTFENLKNLINEISSSKNKVSIINFFPICIGISKIIRNQKNVVNIVVRLKKDNNCTITVFYEYSFLLHRDSFLNKKTTLQECIDVTIQYVETVITGSNIIIIITILTEKQIEKDEVLKIKSNKTFVINASDIYSRFGARIKIGKPSNSEIDDNIISTILSNKCYHQNMSNKSLYKKHLFFKFLPLSYLSIGIIFLGLLGSEINNILFVMPKTLKNIVGAEKEFSIVEKKLDGLKKIAVDDNTFAYVETCSKMQVADSNKIDYTEYATKLAKILEKYKNQVVFSNYSLICNKNCHKKNDASFIFTADGVIFNRSGDYENMLKIASALNNDLKKEFSSLGVLFPIDKLEPKFGIIYDKFIFNIRIFNNAAKE